ncbi:hypothetical protein [Lacticaseibacillus daqingensis]|uniref:hypothetical protein n=1 Tax=Lacticaseibacillus daqingensis TaxID=2486014 RepID=UPI000F7AEB1C|nr:hypothetical protein [Lacticaseibacillus daqingensis]
MFDERQRQLRDRAFRLGLGLLIGGLVVVFGAGLVLGHSLFQRQFDLGAMLVLLPATVVNCDLIWHAAYLKPNRKHTILFWLGLAGLLNLVVLAQRLWWEWQGQYGRPLWIHGQLTSAMTALVAPLCLGAIGLVALAQWWRERRLNRPV